MKTIILTTQREIHIIVRDEIANSRGSGIPIVGTAKYRLSSIRWLYGVMIRCK